VATFGGKLFVMGGKVEQKTGLQATDTIEEYLEEDDSFQLVQTEEYTGKRTLLQPRYVRKSLYVVRRKQFFLSKYFLQLYPKLIS
jgi:hypothetical protein